MQNLAEIRCPIKTFVPKYKKHLTCHRLAVKVTPGSSGEAKCPKHGVFLFEIDQDYKLPEPKTIKVQKA